jgi:hypothetical protein
MIPEPRSEQGTSDYKTCITAMLTTEAKNALTYTKTWQNLDRELNRRLTD